MTINKHNIVLSCITFAILLRSFRIVGIMRAHSDILLGVYLHNMTMWLTRNSGFQNRRWNRISGDRRFEQNNRCRRFVSNNNNVQELVEGAISG